MHPAAFRDNKELFGKIGTGCVSLTDIIQLLGMTQRVATLVLQQDDAEGRIYFRQGVILHARTDGLEGEDALMSLLRWGEAHFAIEDGIASLERATIQKKVETVILDSLTRIDEASVAVIEEPVATTGESSTNVGDQAASVFAEEKRERLTSRPNLPRPRRGARSVAFFQKNTMVMIGTLFAACLPMFWLVTSSYGVSSSDVMNSLPPIQSPVTLYMKPAPARPDPFELSMVMERRESEETEVTPAVEAPTRRPSPTNRPAEADSNWVGVPSGFGAVSVIAEPWARVNLDGIEVGETPLARLRLSTGRHRLSLSNDHVVGTIHDEITIENGQTLIKRYDFNNLGSVKVMVRPWADVSIDGRAVGQTPMGLIPVTVGTHSIRLTHPTLSDVERSITVRSGETTTLNIALEAQP